MSFFELMFATTSLNFLFEFIILEYAGQKTHLIHLAGRIIFASAVYDFPRPVDRHGPGDSHGSSPARQDTHIDLGGTELGGFPGIDKVAHEGQFEPTG